MTITAISEAPAAEPLTAQDRCDRCDAQAFTRFESTLVKVAALLFCAHHARRHENALAEKGFVLTSDQRHVLTNENRLQGADHA